MYDTIKGGDFLNDQDAVEEYVKAAPSIIYELEHMGCVFSRTADGKIAQRSFGGHSKPRACFSADRTGHAILHALHEQLMKQSKSIKIYNEWNMHSLVTEGNRCNGVVVSNVQTGAVEVIQAKAVIFCTGGYGRIFKITTNAFASTADGVMAAFRAGIPIEDAEFVQFHPSGLYRQGILFSEAARGERATGLWNSTLLPAWNWPQETLSHGRSKARSTRAAASTEKTLFISTCGISAKPGSWNASRKFGNWASTLLPSIA
jgi:succinate dehydrogenase / fumarate reductase flavoprotein subunit